MNVKYSLITDRASLRKFMRNLVPGVNALDTESTGLDWFDDTMLGMSLSDGAHNNAFIVYDSWIFNGVTSEEINEEMGSYLTDDKYMWVAHNAKYDLGVLKANGIVDPAIHGDSAMAIHTYDPDLFKQLETSVLRDFKVKKPKFEEIIGKKWGKIDWVEDLKPYVDKKTGLTMPPRITMAKLAQYAVDDTYWTVQLWSKYIKLLKQEDLEKVLFKIETPMCYVLRDMQYRGVNIDLDVLSEIDSRLDTGLYKLTQEIYEEAGCEFNMNSPKQKGEVLFDKLGLPCHKTTPSGGRSTDSDVLEFLAASGYPIAKLMSDYSSLQKLSSGYTKSIPRLISADGRLRCNLNSDGARTGRMSASEPNLQNQPNNEEYNIRSAFVAGVGRKFDIADWSQIELRLMAHCAKDARLIEAFRANADIHQAVADDLHITRKGAKVINFGVLYGMGPQKLAHTLGISIDEAKYIIYKYGDTYSGFARWKEWVEEYARKHGYVRNIFGRVRRLPGAMKPANKEVYFYAMRQAVNTMIQGSAADLMKLTLIDIHNEFAQPRWDAFPVLVVHDEFLLDVVAHQAEEAYHRLTYLMENKFEFRVPIKADGKICDRWSEMKDDSFLSHHLRNPHSTLTIEDFIRLGVL